MVCLEWIEQTIEFVILEFRVQDEALFFSPVFGASGMYLEDRTLVFVKQFEMFVSDGLEFREEFIEIRTPLIGRPVFAGFFPPAPAVFVFRPGGLEVAVLVFFFNVSSDQRIDFFKRKTDAVNRYCETNDWIKTTAEADARLNVVHMWLGRISRAIEIRDVEFSIRRHEIDSGRRTVVDASLVLTESLG